MTFVRLRKHHSCRDSQRAKGVQVSRSAYRMRLRILPMDAGSLTSLGSGLERNSPLIFTYTLFHSMKGLKLERLVCFKEHPASPFTWSSDLDRFGALTIFRASVFSKIIVIISPLDLS